MRARSAAAYLTIYNSGSAPDTLQSVSADVARAAELDHYVASATVRLHPGGYHIMLMQPKPLQPGDRVRLTLAFAHAGTVRITEPVVAATGLPG